MSRSTKHRGIASLAQSLPLAAGTASEALNDNPRVHTDTRKRVMAAALAIYRFGT